MIRIIHLALFLVLVSIPAKGFTQEFLNPDSLKPGMKGYGLTVYKGSKIDRFEVEILGVMKNVRTKGDIILAKLSGEPLEKTGVIAGMSGSPVYINEKLIGAVAFSWAFSKEPIAGITPIQDMLGVFEHSDPTNSFIKRDWFRDYESNPETEKRDNRGSDLQKISTPLVFSGMDDRLFEYVKNQWNQEGFIPMQGGTGTSTDFSGLKDSKTLFQPGSAVAIRLVTGDLNVSGVGTVTYKKDDRILIFGHPMFFRGNCKYPVSTAEIISVFPGYQLSFKLASAGEIVGSTEQDREYAVSCRIGPQPEMVPIRVTQFYSGKTNKYKYNIIDDPLYFGSYLANCVANSIFHDKAPLEKNSYFIKMRINLNDGNVVEWKNLYSELTTVANLMSTLSEMSKPVMQIMINQYKNVSIKSIEVEVDQSDRIHVALIKNMRLLTKGDIFPGDNISIALEMANYQGDSWSTNISVTLPAKLTPGPVMIFATSAREDRLGEEILSSASMIPTTYEQLLQKLSDTPMNNEIVLWGVTREPGLVIEGEKYHNLPQSRYSVLANDREDNSSPMVMRFRKRVPTGYYIFDMRKLMINVKSPRFWRN